CSSRSSSSSRNPRSRPRVAPGPGAWPFRLAPPPMSRTDPIVSAVASCPVVGHLGGRLPGPGESVRVGGVVGSLAQAVVAALHRARPERVFVIVGDDPRSGMSAEADLRVLLGEDGPVHLFPQKEALPYEENEPHLEIGGLRVEAVEALFSGRAKILVTTARGLQERIPVPADLAALRRTLRVGDVTDFGALVHQLESWGFDRVPLVEEVGQLAVRGGTLDLYSGAAGDPVRIEFWGAEIVSIRSFDVLDQRSTAALEETHVLPVDFRRDPEAEGEAVGRALVELLPTDAVLVRTGPADLREE